MPPDEDRVTAITRTGSVVDVGHVVFEICERSGYVMSALFIRVPVNPYPVNSYS